MVIFGRSSSFSSNGTSSFSPRKGKKTSKSDKKDDKHYMEKGSRSKNALFKSGIREMGPIYKRRKKGHADFDINFDKQLENEGKVNQDACFWLSSSNASPRDFGIMSTWDPFVDRWFLPLSLKSVNFSLFKGKEIKFFDGSLLNPIEEATLTLEGGSSIEERVLNNCFVEIAKTGFTGSSVVDSQNNSNTLSKYINSSPFWDFDKTGIWVSLINLSGEDSKWISDVDSEWDDLRSDFPSPTFETNRDSQVCSSNIGLSSSAGSTLENSYSELSSELLSESIDWEMNPDEPLFWPFNENSNWNLKWDCFSVSPRKDKQNANCKSQANRKDNLKERYRRSFVFVSQLKASKMSEFKRGSCKNGIARRFKSTQSVGKRFKRFMRRFPPILEKHFEESFSPTKSRHQRSLSSDLLSESTAWDEMGLDDPLFWPLDQRYDSSLTWDFLCLSPRKAKGGINAEPRTSVKLRCHGRKSVSKPGYKRSFVHVSKIVDFKHGLHKNPSRRKNKPAHLQFGNSTTYSVFGSMKLKHGSRNGLRFGGKSAVRFLDMLPPLLDFDVKEAKRKRPMYTVGTIAEFMDDEFTWKEVPIETMLGLNEFDGHEGTDEEFKEDAFSLGEHMEE